jgi:hypothetical protein
MRSKHVHDRKLKPRRYFGEAEAAVLLSWLNSENPSDKRRHARAKVERGMELIRSLYEMAENSARREPSKEFLRRQQELNEWLLEFEFVNGLYSEKSSGLTWKLNNSADLTERDYVSGEADAVVRVVELAKMGVLGKIRKCECGRYFFARFSKQRFHEDGCRERFWEASPIRKEQKRKNAREYYYLQTNKNVK